MMLKTNFKLPITYNNKKQTIDNSLSDDIEINNVYKKILNPQDMSSSAVLDLWKEYYTTDKQFLKDTQKLILNYESKTTLNNNDVLTIWNDNINDKNFKEKYYYFGYDFMEPFNKSELAMQLLSVFTFVSPLLSLITPLLVLLIPFFIIRVNGLKISIQKYTETLFTFLKKFPISKILNMEGMNITQKIYTVISFLFYLFQMYQNTMSCYNFYKKTNLMYDHLEMFKTHCKKSIKEINNFMDVVTYKSYEKFNQVLSNYSLKLKNIVNELSTITLNSKSLSRCNQTGRVMKHFYKIYYDNDYIDTLNYTFGFYGYLGNLIQIKSFIQNKSINLCKFTKKSTYFKNSYYGLLDEEKIITNDYDLKNNYVISGPNATGKTTFIKSTLLNIILSQQIGAGFYDSAKINPFHYLHCYINIPDTSGRDSLFQAEVRRCKVILDKINKEKNKKHFCIFDELFSGTNPYEAVSAGYGYLNYLDHNKNITFMLTTHYIDLCKKYIDHNSIKNYNTKTKYHLTKGISDIKGGIKILHDLEYPNIIIKDAEKIINNYDFV